MLNHLEDYVGLLFCCLVVLMLEYLYLTREDL